MIIGIDPGASGGIALLANNGMDLEVHAMPWLTGQGINPEPIRSWLIQADKVFIEEIQVRIGEGVKATKTSCSNWGRLIGMAEALQRPLFIVRPQVWQSFAGINIRERKERKAAAVAKAQRIWPSVSFLPTERCKVPSDGMAEAALIAEYGRRTNGVS